MVKNTINITLYSEIMQISNHDPVIETINEAANNILNLVAAI